MTQQEQVEINAQQIREDCERDFRRKSRENAFESAVRIHTHPKSTTNNKPEDVVKTADVIYGWLIKDTQP